MRAEKKGQVWEQTMVRRRMHAGRERHGKAERAATELDEKATSRASRVASPSQPWPRVWGQDCSRASS